MNTIGAVRSGWGHFEAKFSDRAIFLAGHTELSASVRAEFGIVEILAPGAQPLTL